MDKRDEELDQMLEPLRGEQPSPVQLGRWKKALDHAAKRPSSARRWRTAGQLLAACLVGAVLGSWMVYRPPPTPICTTDETPLLAEEISPSDATIERIHIKLD